MRVQRTLPFLVLSRRTESILFFAEIFPCVFLFRLSPPLQRAGPVVGREEQGQRVGRLGGGHVRHDSRVGAASTSQVRCAVSTHTCYPTAPPLGSFSLSTLHGRHSCFVVVQTLHLPVMLAGSFFFKRLVRCTQGRQADSQTRTTAACVYRPPHQSQEFCDAGSVLANPADEVHDQRGHGTGIHHGKRTVSFLPPPFTWVRVCEKNCRPGQRAGWGGRILLMRCTHWLRFEAIRWKV